METNSNFETIKVVVLIPAYNEEGRIAPVVRESLQTLPVLVVDDGSRDNTAQVAREAGAQVVVQQPNQGKGAALKLGFRTALADGYDAVITLDADGQHSPEHLSEFLHVFQQSACDLVIGNRDFSQMPFSRRLANSLGQRMYSWAVGQAILDNQSGYRLIGSRLMRLLLEEDEQGFEFEVEMITQCLRHGMKLCWTPIKTIYAGEGSHIQPVKHAARFINLILRTRRRMKTV